MGQNLGLSNQRSAPRIEVLRGFVATLPDSLTLSLPLKSTVDPTTVKSGMALRVDTTAGVDSFVLADSSDTFPSKVYIAHYDGDDFSVVESGVMVAYDLDGNFRFETPYIVGSGVAGNPLILSSTAGWLEVKATPVSNDKVCGTIGTSGVRDASADNSNVAATVNGSANPTRLVTVWDPTWKVVA